MRPTHRECNKCGRPYECEYNPNNGRLVYRFCKRCRDNWQFMDFPTRNTADVITHDGTVLPRRGGAWDVGMRSDEDTGEYL
jgi:hypothetical protein